MKSGVYRDYVIAFLKTALRKHFENPDTTTLQVSIELPCRIGLSRPPPFRGAGHLHGVVRLLQEKKPK
jgi:hypothetical protein